MNRVVTRLVAGAVVLSAVAVGVGWLRRAVSTPRPAGGGWLRRFVTRRFNPLVIRLGLVGGRRSPWAYVEHVGRRSGHVYRTPVLPTFFGDFAYIPLQYGPDVHWARNIRAAGACRLQVHERVYELDEPADVTAAEHPGVPEALRPWMERRGRRYLRLHLVSVRPGRLDGRAGPEPAAERAAAITAPEPPEVQVPAPV